MDNKSNQKDKPVVIRTPDHRLRVFVSSTLKELAQEREAARQAILNLRLVPVMFESGARSHPSQEIYRAYLSQSHLFVGIYWQSYGWVPPDEQISGLEDEFLLSENLPRLIYIKDAKAEREPGLKNMLARIKGEDMTSYKYFATATELGELLENDLALLLTEHFESARAGQRSVEISHHPSNVPTPRNPLLGRAEELALASEMLLREDVGMVSLIGPGGTGKSRLGLQVALEMLTHFHDGVYLVRLTPIRDPDLVIPTIADTLGIPETNDRRTLLGKLKDYLRDKKMLLLLDNFEQVLEAAPNIAELMEACPELRFVTTSRAPLHLRGEKELFVPPLAIPAHFENIDLQSLTRYASVELFIQRAQSIRPDFNVTSENAATIAEICHRLDGLPLAIELAAARIKLLTPHELLSRLERRFDVLRGGSRDLPERQQTLRGAIDWSYNLLSDQARRLFRRLSIFVGGWSMEAAEAVCNLNGDIKPDVMDEVQALVDNSLLMQSQDEDGQTRFGMLETIREYAHERLIASAEIDLIRRQHALYFFEFARKVEPLTRSRERIQWTRKMRQDFDNIRAILEWGCSTGENVEIAQQLAITLAWFWRSSMSVSESRQWADCLLQRVDDSTPLAIHAGLLWGAGGFAWSQGELEAAVTQLDESLRLCRAANDKYLLANILIIRGVVAAYASEAQTARALYEESLELFRSLGRKWGESLALSRLGDVALFEKDYERAHALHEQGIAIAREQGDPWILFIPLISEGNLALVTGIPQKAEPVYDEAISLLREIDDKWGLAWGLNGLGHASLQLDQVDLARSSFEEGIAVARNIGNPGALLASLLGTAILAARPSQSMSGKKSPIPSLINAIKLLGAIPALTQNSHVLFWIGWRELYEQAVANIHAIAAEDIWAKAFAEGQALTMAQAATLALRELDGKQSHDA